MCSLSKDLSKPLRCSGCVLFYIDGTATRHALTNDMFVSVTFKDVLFVRVVCNIATCTLHVNSDCLRTASRITASL
jgi:hypothetical protein